mgnify:CR=1 FL=1
MERPLGKIVTVKRLAHIRASTVGKPRSPVDAHFTGYIYRLTRRFHDTKYLTILAQGCCVIAKSLPDAILTDPARILVYSEIGIRQIESSEIITCKIESDGRSAVVNTENCVYEIIVQNM